MKQTNNAIKFLMAHMATALVLTAGLAAGQAQAATEIYQSTATDISQAISSTITAPDQTTYPGPNTSLPSAAGNDGTGSSVADKTVNIGSGEYVSSTTSWAAGGILVNSGATATSTNLSATNNTLNLKAGATIGSGSYGAYLFNEKGNVSATGNKVTLNNIASGATVTVTTGGASSSDGIFGARVKSTNGSATATGNYVDITAHYGAALTLNHGGNGIVGALAEGTDTVSVTGNYVTITGTDVGTDPSHRLALGSGGTNAHTLIGGFALNQTANKTASTLTAASNYVTASNISIGGASGAYIFGGRAMNTDDANGSSDIFARNNYVNLSNVAVSNSAADPSTDGVLQVVGNMAVATDLTAAPNDTRKHNNVSAIGDGTTVNLKIDGGTITNTSTDLTSGPLNSNSIVAGGYAETQSGGGNATASANVAQITNLKATNVNFYGGVAVDNSAANSGDQLVASQNSLSLDNTSIAIDPTTATGYTTNSIAGGVAALTGSDLSKASVTASNNTVSVSNSGYTEAEGAFISTYDKSGAAITASHNAVTVGDNIKVTGDVIGAQASHNGTFVGNTVSFDATLKADSAKTIAGVKIGTGTTGGTEEKPDVITLTNNTVTLGANAETTNVDIYAAKLGTNNNDDNKTQIIHSGNTAIANGTHIYDDGDEHAISADDIQIGSTALIHVKNSTTLDISGLATGDNKYLNGTGTVAAGARIVNQGGTINVFNSLAVQGDDTLIAASEGALLAVNGGSGATAANANVDSVTKEGATLKISAAGLTNYLTAPEGADSTPSYDLDGDGVNETYDKKGALRYRCCCSRKDLS